MIRPSTSIHACMHEMILFYHSFNLLSQTRKKAIEKEDARTKTAKLPSIINPKNRNKNKKTRANQVPTILAGPMKSTYM